MLDLFLASVTPPAPSRATRNVLGRSNASVRGVLLAKTPADVLLRKFSYESIGERNSYLVTLLDPRMHDIWDQPTTVPYRDEQGAIRRHTFDFLVRLKNGEKVAYAVKPYARAVETRFDLKLQQIARHLPKRFADRIVLLTERSYSWERVRNAAHLNHYRWRIDGEADEIAECVISNLTQSVLIQDLVDRIGLGGRGYGAVMRQIAERRLRCIERCLINEETLVARGDA